jgi:biopolymer transport protein ExbB/TolQ
MWGQLAHSFQNANNYVLVIAILGFIGTFIFLERMFMYWRVFGIDFKKFLSNLKKMVSAEDVDRAISLCKNVSKTSLPGIALKALEAAETDPTTIRGAIEEETIDFLPQIEKRLGVLPALALLIMLVGILGTIDSLWSAFNAVDVLDTAKKQASLAQGISSSLNPTALALVFGMFLLAGYHILRGFAVNITERIHHGVTVLHNLLVPVETAQFVPMTAAAPSAAMAAPMAMAEPAPVEAASDDDFSEPADDGDVGDDSFDDVSVEDIKDEEEII